MVNPDYVMVPLSQVRVSAPMALRVRACRRLRRVLSVTRRLWAVNWWRRMRLRSRRLGRRLGVMRPRFARAVQSVGDVLCGGSVEVPDGQFVTLDTYRLSSGVMTERAAVCWGGNDHGQLNARIAGTGTSLWAASLCSACLRSLRLPFLGFALSDGHARAAHTWRQNGPIAPC